MNTFDEQNLAEFLKSLNLSQTNQELALAYLGADHAGDELLNGAEPMAFREVKFQQRLKVIEYMRAVHQSRDQDLIARVYKLFWAIGKASAVCVLTFLTTMVHNRVEALNQCIDALGIVPTIAMEAHKQCWSAYETGSATWLRGLGRNHPEFLEEAQSICIADNQSSLILSAFLLTACEDEAFICRQAEFLAKAVPACILSTDLGMTDADKQKLAAYVEQGDPAAAVPAFTIAGLSPFIRISRPGSQMVGLAGTASFLAAGRDPHIQCALQVFARLNPDALLSRILETVTPGAFLRELDHLVDALPEGKSQLLLYLAMNPLQDDLSVLVAEKLQDGLEAALKKAGTKEYIALQKMYPQMASGGQYDLEEWIIRAFCEDFRSNRDEMDAYLREQGDLSHAAEDLRQFPVRYYCYTGDIGDLMLEYRNKYGWNDFMCRCTVAFGLLMDGKGIWGLIPRKSPGFEEGLEKVSAALLERNLPVRDLLNLTCYNTSSEYDDVPARAEKVIRKLVTKADYLQQLQTAARESTVPARQMAVTVLDELSREPACADGVRKALLACTADSSKQVRELLQTVLTAHPEWAADCAALLKSKKADQRLLAVSVLAKQGEQMRPALEEALAAEKSSKVADAIRNILGQTSLAGGSDLVEWVLKGNKIRKVQWLLDQSLPELHKSADGTAVSDDHRAAILVAYSELGRIGRSDTAAELAKDLDTADLAALAHGVFDAWMNAGAQAKTKWVLPFAAVFGGVSMTAKLIRAINDWPQHARGAIACDAVTALALSTDPAALLAVDAISRKFKFRQVKTAAAAALENAAQELGITAEELADRIVPDLGFGTDGKRVFDYGQRSFTVCLTPTLELEITNNLGKKVKNLPAPGKTDDADKAAEAYEAFKTMKKQIRTTVSTQKARLEAALSVMRCWDSEAWQALFVRNPIMHQFAISLIWGVYEDGKLTDTFRYMEDGSFNTVDEDEYELPAGASIGLVHPIELDAETLEGWKQQLEDYEITQSVQQLERPVYTQEETGRSLERFGGRMLNGLSLSGKLLGLGWYRGSVQDGGMFGTFYREDPGMGYAVELNFSGSIIGDENDTVTVYDAVFYKPGTVKRGSYIYDTPKDADIFDLASIPARYYSEIIYQLERATASSTERNENWKTER